MDSTWVNLQHKYIIHQSYNTMFITLIMFYILGQLHHNKLSQTHNFIYSKINFNEFVYRRFLLSMIILFLCKGTR